MKAVVLIGSAVLGFVLFGMAVAAQGDQELASAMVRGSVGMFLILAALTGGANLLEPRWRGLIFALLLMILPIIGTFELVPGVRQYRREHETLSWPSTPGTVLSSRVFFDPPRSHKGGEYFWEVRYRYVVDGATHEADTISRGTSRLPRMGCCAETHKRALEATYPAGKSVTVFHHPSRHREAVLQPGPGREVGFKLAGGITLVAAGALNTGLLLLRLRRWRAERSPADPSKKLRPPPGGVTRRR
jgi:hypothetical protein